MKCPKCDLLTSDSRDNCPRCGLDLRPLKTRLGLPVSGQAPTFSERPSPSETPIPTAKFRRSSSWITKLLPASRSSADQELSTADSTKSPPPSLEALSSFAEAGSRSTVHDEFEQELRTLIDEVEELEASNKPGVGSFVENTENEDFSDLVEALDRMGPGMDNADLSSADLQALDPKALSLYETYQQAGSPAEQDEALDELSDLSWMLTDEEQAEAAADLAGGLQQSTGEQRANPMAAASSEDFATTFSTSFQTAGIGLNEEAPSEESLGFDDEEMLRELAAALEAAVDDAGTAASALQDVEFERPGEDESKAELSFERKSQTITEEPNVLTAPSAAEDDDDEPLFDPEMLEALRRAAEPKEEDNSATETEVETSEYERSVAPAEQFSLSEAYPEQPEQAAVSLSESTPKPEAETSSLSFAQPPSSSLLDKKNLLDESSSASLSSSDARRLSTKVTPAVLEFDDDDQLLEEQLDAILGDMELNVEAIKVEKPDLPSKNESEAVFLDDDLEIAFEIDFEDEEEEEEALPLPSASPAVGEDDTDLLQGLMDSFAEIQAGTTQQSIVPTVDEDHLSELEESLTQALSDTTRNLPAESLDSLEMELEQELAGLMAEGTSFFGLESEPKETLSTLPAEEPKPLELPPELAELNRELEDELSALEGEGFSVFSLNEETKSPVITASSGDFELSATEAEASNLPPRSSEEDLFTEGFSETTGQETKVISDIEASFDVAESTAEIPDFSAYGSEQSALEDISTEETRAVIPSEEEAELTDALAELLATEEALKPSFTEQAALSETQKEDEVHENPLTETFLQSLDSREEEEEGAPAEFLPAEDNFSVADKAEQSEPAATPAESAEPRHEPANVSLFEEPQERSVDSSFEATEDAQRAFSSLLPEFERSYLEETSAANDISAPESESVAESPELSDALAELLATEQALSSSMAEIAITEESSPSEGSTAEPAEMRDEMFQPVMPEVLEAAASEPELIEQEVSGEEVFEIETASQKLPEPTTEPPALPATLSEQTSIYSFADAEETATDLPEPNSDGVSLLDENQEPLDTEDFSPIASAESRSEQSLSAFLAEFEIAEQSNEQVAAEVSEEEQKLFDADSDAGTSTQPGITTILLTEALSEDVSEEEEDLPPEEVTESALEEATSLELSEVSDREAEEPISSALQTAVFFADDLRRIFEEKASSAEEVEDITAERFTADNSAATETAETLTTPTDEIELDELFTVFQDEVELAPPPLPSESRRWSKPVFATADAAGNTLAAIDPALWAEVEEQLEQPRSLIETEISLSDICAFETGAVTDLLFEMASEEIADPAKRRRHETAMPTSAERTVNSAGLVAAVKRYAHDEKRLEQQKEEERQFADRPLSVPVKPAAFWQRLIAGGTDLIVAALVTLVFGLAGILPPELRTQVLFLEPLNAIDFLPYVFDHLLLLYAVWVGMSALLLSATGRTIGCRLARMEVMNSQGFPITFAQGMIRGMLQVAALFSGGLFFLPALWGKRAHLPDRLSRTQAGRRLFEMTVDE